MPSILVTGLSFQTDEAYEAFCDVLERTAALEMSIPLGWCVADILPSKCSKRGQTNTVMIRLITGLFAKGDYKGAPPKLVTDALVHAAQALCPDREVECMVVHVVGKESSIVHVVT